MLNAIYTETESRMQKCGENLKNELTKLRTGRAHTSLLDHIKISYFGNEVPLNQVGSVSVADARTLTITVWDKSAITAVEKAIMGSDLGLNPAVNGNLLRIPLPPLTQQRRTELVKIVKREAEDARISVRSVRRDSLTKIKELLKHKSIGEDEEKAAEEKIQKITDKFVAEIEKISAHKETELMQI